MELVLSTFKIDGQCTADSMTSTKPALFVCDGPQSKSGKVSVNQETP